MAAKTLRTCLAAVAAFLLAPASLLCAAGETGSRLASAIDRKALVARHDPILRHLDAESPLTVGNGEFAFTVDATGLQTFPEAYEKTIPLGTLSHWGWHTFPNSEGWSIDRFRFTEFESHGRRVPYADIPGNKPSPEAAWLRGNPHRLHLGQIGFVLGLADGQPARTNDLADIEQRLELWNGIVRSRFKFDGQMVEVETLCHPTLDLLAVRVVSPLLGDGRLAIRLQFPYGTGRAQAADWSRPGAHESLCAQPRPGYARFARKLDRDSYHAAAAWSPAAKLSETGRHCYVLRPEKGTAACEFVCHFSPRPFEDQLPSFAQARSQTVAHWDRFWRGGGAVDLSGSRDARWRELERRIVLSQYLTAIQCAGSLPPQESGLTFNSWEGKFHLEMHWWHAAHFALWQRTELLERSLGFYQAILPRAQATARKQGYLGARWPKMTDPVGAESPSSVGPFLVWQQPHPIYFAELCYRAHSDRATLEKHREVVFETARFMASFATWQAASNRYVLGPPLQCAQEVFPKDRTFNPTYELTAWRWGLETAQRWRERLGLPREPAWEHVLRHLSRPSIADGKYLFAESAPDTYVDRRWVNDHPSVTAALGVLPGPGIDRETMRATFQWIWTNWNWPRTWGWDYPMVAMCAARLGEADKAVSALLMPTEKNRYRVNGHNHQRPGLTIYLPGNGGLLAAVAMMAAGWDGAPPKHAPGFPDDGTWQVRWENLRPLP